jgi:hypothetical protein
LGLTPTAVFALATPTPSLYTPVSFPFGYTIHATLPCCAQVSLAVGVDVVPDAVQAAQALAQAQAVAGVPGSPETAGARALFLCADLFKLPVPFTVQHAVRMAEGGAQAPAGGGDEAWPAQTGPQECDADAGHGVSSGSGGGTERAAATPNGGEGRLFDFAYDCQSFHVLRQVGMAHWPSELLLRT